MAGVLDIIRHYQQAIEKHPDDEQRVLRSIGKLHQLSVTVDHLQETGVGRTVNALRKEPGDVGHAARSLVNKWKHMVTVETMKQEAEANNHEASNANGNSDKDRNPGGHQSDHRDRYSDHKDTCGDHNRHGDHKERHCDLNRCHSSSRNINGDQNSSKRKQQSSDDDEEPYTKKSRHQHTSESEDNEQKPDVKIKSEPQTSNSDESDSDSDDSDSDSSQGMQIKKEIKQEPIEQHSSDRHHSKESSKKSDEMRSSHESKHRSSEHSSRHDQSTSSKYEQSSSKHKDSHKSKEREIESSSDKHKSKERHHEASPEKRHKTHNKEQESSKKHSSDKERSSSSHIHSSSSEKHKSSHGHDSSEKHKSDKHKSRSSKSHRTSNSDEDHKSSSDRHKSKESSSKNHSSSSDKEKIKERSNASKDKSSHNDRKHSSSDTKPKSSDSKSKLCKAGDSSSGSETKHKSSSSSTSKSTKSSSKTKETVPKNKKSRSEDSDDGIGCESGASFAEALGMLSPSKPKKKSGNIRDVSSPASSSEMGVASLLAPSTKLAPLPALEISALPEISPNYKPRPPPRLLPHFSDEEALSASISSKNQRTKVYSGNKMYGMLPSLYEMCVQVLQNHIDALEYTGGVPYDILKPVVDKASPQQLFVLEHYNPYLMEDTDHLWQAFCTKHFRKQKREEMETWREMYIRCQEEQETRLRSLTQTIKIAQEAKKAPVKQTKMAYVDTVVKPPRNIARKQAIHGTARLAAASPAARVASLASAPLIARPGSTRPPPAPSASLASLNRPKKAPLMQKALQFMRGRKR